MGLVFKLLPYAVALLLASYIAFYGIGSRYPFYPDIRHAKGIPVETPEGIYMIPVDDYIQAMKRDMRKAERDFLNQYMENM